MGRRIAFCADGTWDTVSNDTNVYRISKAIVPIPGEQYSFYDDTIASVYEAGDAVFIFGFSGGAYTARSLAGMIAACGLPTKNPDPVLYRFLDTGLNAQNVNAYHAVATDERRVEFPATLWTSAPIAGQTIEQVYFRQ